MKRSTAQRGARKETAELHLEKWLPYRFSVVVNAVSLQLARFYHEKFGLTVYSWRMMAALGRTSPLSAIELAKMTAMDQVSVTRAINDLAALGMVVRRTDAKDRRRASLRLSAKGLEAYEAIVPHALELEAALIEGVSRAELDKLDRLMVRIQHNAASLREKRQPGEGEEQKGADAAVVPVRAKRIVRRHAATRIQRSHPF